MASDAGTGGAPAAWGAGAVLVTLILCVSLAGAGRAAAQQTDVDMTPGPRAVLASAVVPGSGQLLRGQRRAWLYLAAEALSWYLHVDRRRDGNRLRGAYRDLAWDVARLKDGPRVDESFGYYEHLSRWTSSGAFDTDPSRPGIQPEEDVGTYNGAVWARARALFFGDVPDEVRSDDPAWDEALALYRSEAYGPGYLWDWGGAPDEQTRFANLIRRSDDHLQEATTMLGLIVANHVLSAADAFVSHRLERASGHRMSTRLSVGAVRYDPDGFTPDVRFELLLGLGR